MTFNEKAWNRRKQIEEIWSTLEKWIFIYPLIPPVGTVLITWYWFAAIKGGFTSGYFKDKLKEALNARKFRTRDASLPRGGA